MTAATLVVLLIAAIVTAIAFDTRPDGASNALAVPYVDNPFTPPELFPTLPPAPADLTDCQLSDFTIVSTERQTGPDPSAAVTSAAFRIALRNDSQACALGGAPVITLSSPSGAGEPITAAQPAASEPTDLPPRWTVEIGGTVVTGVFLAGQPCSRFPDPTWELTVADEEKQQLTTMVPAPGCTEPDSVGDIVRSGLWEPYRAPAGPRQPVPTDDLAVTLTVPETVLSDGPLLYTATILNPTDQSISLSPCPRYRQAFGEGGIVSEYYGTLNCAEAPESVGPGDKVTFEMQIALPPEFTAGFAGMLSWTLNPEDGPGAMSEKPVAVT